MDRRSDRVRWSWRAEDVNARRRFIETHRVLGALYFVVPLFALFVSLLLLGDASAALAIGATLVGVVPGGVIAWWMLGRNTLADTEPGDAQHP
jgi:predicted Na+-dependent transporter